MRYFYSLLLFGVAVEGSRIQLKAQSIPTFASFVQSYKRLYEANSSEYNQRRALYEKRRATAISHNEQANRLWSAGVNKLWDWTDEELAQLNGRRGHASVTRGGKLAAVHASTFMSKSNSPSENSTKMTAKKAATSKDWKHLEVGQRVPDQGMCGSCWAIAVSTVLQAHVEIHKQKTRTFAVQEMNDCIPNPDECGGKGGCRGATMEMAMDYVFLNGCAEAHETPYEAQDGQCMKTLGWLVGGGGGLAFGMTGWEKLPENEYDPLLQALQDGPVGVSVAASEWNMYAVGIFDRCSKDAVVNHAVAMFGYGQENGVKYWTIQNSWGTEWGENGYMRLLRHDESDIVRDTWCGVDKEPEVGTGCKGGPPEVWVCGMCGVLYDSVIPYF